MTRQHNYYVYLLTNKNNRVIYVGMTNDLNRRMYEHQHKLIDGFTKRYNLTKLVYFEETTDVQAAIAREKQIKKWRREKKDNLIATTNPHGMISVGISRQARNDKYGGKPVAREPIEIPMSVISTGGRNLVRA